ncbi:DUF6458 family protein [Rathayibacter sp. YIM 133350]|uniref:DUF6458 family protein n=1 Tax=Rathayibacter sp. YIM 133350 TaxID=3131992 RepID=UPI00307E69CA
MSIGGGIFLIALGAILVWALNVDLGWLDLDIVGYVLMAAGVVILIVGLALLLRRRRSVSETRTGVDANGARVIRNESSTPEL